MPSEKLGGGGSAKKKSKKSFFDRIPGSKIASQTAKDLGNIAKNAPGGIYAITRGAAEDVKAGRYSTYGPLIVPRSTKKQVVADAKSTGTILRHPLRNPGYTLITALGLAAPAFKGAATGVRVGAATKEGAITAAQKGLRKAYNPKSELPLGGTMKPLSVRGAVKESWKKSAPSKTPTRTLRLVPTVKSKGKPSAEELKRVEVLQNASFMPKWKKDANLLQLRNGKPATYAIEVEIPASRKVSTRAAEQTVDKLRAKSPKRQQKKIERELSINQDYIKRAGDPDPIGISETVKAIKNKKITDKGYRGQTLKKQAHSAVSDVNSTTRAARLYRIPYVLANQLGSHGTALIQQGHKYPKMFMNERKLRGAFGADLLPKKLGGKESSAASRFTDRSMGETLTEAMFDTGAGGVPTHLMRGVGTTAGKLTDRRRRSSAYLYEAEQHGLGIDDIADLQKKIAAGDPMAQAIHVQIARRAEKAAIKFSRSKPLEGVKESKLRQLDRGLAEMVFLYKWITGSTGYATHMLREKPTLTAALAVQGQQAPDIRDVIPEVPDFMTKLLPTGERDGMPTAANLQAASLWDMPGEIAHTLGMAKEDPLWLGEHLNPAPHMGLTYGTGRDLFREYRLKQGQEGPLDRLRFASDVEFRSIPWLKPFPAKWGGRWNDTSKNRLYPMTNREIVMDQLFGGLYSKRINPKVAKQMARQQKNKPGQKRRKKRKDSF